MAGQLRKTYFAPVAQTAGQLIDPLLRKKAGLNMRLLENWPEIVGADIADSVLPLKIIWPRQSGAEVRAGGLAAGQLVLACCGYAALRAQHETAEIEARINRFFGWRAIDRIRIEQVAAPAGAARRRANSGGGEAMAEGGLLAGFAAGAFVPAGGGKARPLSPARQAQLAEIKDAALRASLQKLAAALEKG